MTREDLHKAFTQEQLDWLIKNGAKPEGNTDGEILSNYAKLLWANRQWQGKDGAVALNRIINGKQVSYDLQSIAQAAGYSDDPGKDGKKAADKFYDAYFGGEKDKDARDRWRTGVYEAYGDGSWDKVRKVLQGESRNRMLDKIDRDREAIIEAENEGAGTKEWIQSALMGLFMPAQKRAYKEGRDPGFSEISRDVIGNALYAIPASKFAAIPKAAAAKILVNHPLGKTLVRGAANAASQFVVPATVAAMNAAADDGDFITDAIAGGLTNLGVNRVIGPRIGQAMGTLQGKVTTRLPSKIRRILEGAPDPRDLADDIVAEAESKLKTPQTTISEAVKEGKKGIKVDELYNAKDVRDLARMAEMGPVEELAEYGNTPERILGTAAAMRYATESAAKSSALLNNDAQLKKYLEKRVSELSNKYTSMLEQSPELMTLFRGQKPFKDAAKEWATVTIPDAAMAYAVNKAGNRSARKIAGNAFGIDTEGMYEEADRQRAERKRNSEAEQILRPRLDSLTGKDREYLQAIIDKPEIIQGYGIGNSQEFRNWYLLRGQDLLSGTKYFRPAPEVK